jgi:cysteine synthase
LNLVRSGPGLLEAIGSTPHAELSQFSAGTARIFAKLEFLNPGGSVKDRIARSMIEDAEKRGLLRPGGTIVEPTSGNTGVGLAMVAAVKGYRCIVVMPEGYGRVKATLMEALGAEVIRTPADELMSGAIRQAEQIARETGAYLPNQFANPVNPRTHYETTGPEIFAELGGSIDAASPGSSPNAFPVFCESRRNRRARSSAAASGARTLSRGSASRSCRRFSTGR